MPTSHTAGRAGRAMATLRRVAAAAATLLVAACSGGDAISGPDGGQTPRGDLPVALVGDWAYGSISPSNFWNDHTGTFGGNAYGFADYLDLDHDGDFTRLIYIYTNSYGCQTQVWTQMKGTMTADQSTFTLYATEGQYKVADSCDASRNYSRPMNADEVAQSQGDVFSWAPAQIGGTQVILVNPFGADDAPATYERQ